MILSSREKVHSLSLKILKLDHLPARIAIVATALICLSTAWLFIKWNFANVVASHIDPERPESILVADWLTQVAPNDPQTHFTAATLYEKTFNADDLSRSLNEYETAAALSPNNFVMWLDLGKARSLSGDAERAEAAYRRASDLAPNYATVRWAYGNLLIRQDRLGEGFALLAKAADSNAGYSDAAAVTALQVFDGDLVQVRQAMGDGDAINASLATALANGARYDEALDAWSRVAADVKRSKFKESGEKLFGQMVAAKKYRYAANIAASLQDDNNNLPLVGQIGNGGFENGVKLRNAPLFEWQIAEGVQPQIGLNETQKYSGAYSLLIVFNSFETAGFRSVAQTVAVEPGAAYRFSVFYKSDVKTSATFRWEVADAVTSAPLASTPSLVPVTDWTPETAVVKVPPGVDGIIVRFVREGCTGPSCPTNGRILFDDFELIKIAE